MSYATICHDKLEYFPKRSAVPSTTISRHRWLFHRSFASARQLDHRTLLDLRYWNFLGESASWLQYLDVVTAERPALAIGLGSFDGFFGRLADFPGTTIDRRTATGRKPFCRINAQVAMAHLDRNICGVDRRLRAGACEWGIGL
jgi:hypothetical protein